MARCVEIKSVMRSAWLVALPGHNIIIIIIIIIIITIIIVQMRVPYDGGCSGTWLAHVGDKLPGSEEPGGLAGQGLVVHDHEPP